MSGPGLSEEELKALRERTTVVSATATDLPGGNDDEVLARVREIDRKLDHDNLRWLQAKIAGLGSRFWRLQPPGKGGRPSEQEIRIEELVQAYRDGAATRHSIAIAVGAVKPTQAVDKDGWTDEPGQFRRDMTAAGGMEGIRQRAR